MKIGYSSIFYLVIFLGWSGSNAHATDSFSVFVSLLPQKYFVERIGGSRVQVSVMVEPGRSEEIYEPTPKQMIRLAQAKFYFRIGMPFEDIWLKSIVKANPNIKVIDCRQDIPLLFTPIASMDRDNHHGAVDPHIWTSPPLVKIMAVHIRDVLVESDPDYSHQFEKNYQDFIQDLDKLDQFIRRTLSGLSHHRFMVFHPAWRYFAHTYGLEEIAIEYAGKDPGAKSLSALIMLGRQEGIRTIFVQKQFSQANAELVARAIGADVIV